MIRNILFSFFFFLGIILICVIYIPALVLPKFVVLSGGKMMGYWSAICLRIFLSTKIIIKGKENLIKNESFFIAASHQSMFETFFLQTIFNSPIFILKKELLKIPLFGLYLKKIGSISIDRDKTTKENLKFFDKIKQSISKYNRPLIIFPQGTRSLPDERPPFKKGAGRIYEELKIKCQPVAINSGNVWPKNGKMSSNKDITISILQPINYGMDRDSFVKKLQNNIYSELDNLD
jgi:1-acyl-sn-glycerol-3-phosphate acyltransferase|tara:strand:- start:2653 stop:3354 length:702 start_codon:yes stop_codon:yes gene_type:complete